MTDITIGKIIDDKWTASKDISYYFSLSKSKPIITATPSPTPGADDSNPVNHSLMQENAKVTAITDTLTPSRPAYKADQDVPTPMDDYAPPSPAPHPQSGAGAYVYPVESGVEPDYSIQPGDTLDVVFYRVQRATVDMKGDIHLVSAVGNAEAVIPASGKSSDQIAKLAAASGLDFTVLSNPAIRVKVAQFAESVAIVIGSVQNPSRIKIDPEGDISVRDIIGRAGGLSIPEKNAVALVRRGEKVVKFDLGRSDAATLARFAIRPGDIITVTRRKE